MEYITFAKKYPAYHPQAGEPTFFLQKILHSLLPDGMQPVTSIGWPAKHHTIRGGHHWKEGDMFSARQWKDRPYNSPQVEFAKIKVVKTWDFIIHQNRDIEMPQAQATTHISMIAENDGLELQAFLHWFFLSPEFKKKKSFDGQIICWNPNINY